MYDDDYNSDRDWDNRRSGRGSWERDPYNSRGRERNYSASEPRGRDYDRFPEEDSRSFEGRSARGYPRANEPGWREDEPTLRPGWGSGGGYGQGGVNWSARRIARPSEVEPDRNIGTRERQWRSSNVGVDYGRPIEYSRGGFAGRGPRGYKRSDERILEDVCETLTVDPRLDPSNIEVTVINGEVTLNGEVEHRSDKKLAEDIAESISGVTDVHNKLKPRHGVLAEMFGKKDDRVEMRE